MYSNLDPVVLTSEDSIYPPTFTGYAFSESNLVIGPSGYREWLNAGSVKLTPHLDGCYMILQQEHEGTVVGADFKGYCKLFVYRHASHWGVSNSFAQLLAKVRALGWPATPRESSLAAWSIPGGFWQQLHTFDTAVREVSLLPRTYTLRIDTHGTLHEIPSFESPHTAEPGDYRTAMRRFIETWIGRIGTIGNTTGASLRSELTGGLDSRVVLSLALSARQFSLLDSAGFFSATSSVSSPVDFAIAERLSNTYRVPLNTGSPSTLGADLIAQFTRWRDFALGSYGPIYWPPATPNRGSFAMGGHGGEGHRVYWRYTSPMEALMEREDRFPSRLAFQQAVRSLEETTHILSHADPGTQPTLAHYREFRDRLHSGLHVMHQVRLQPLASHLLYAAATSIDEKAMHGGQMLYDVISQTAPALLATPFDDDSKSPTKQILNSIVRPVKLNPTCGKIFGLSPSVTTARQLPQRPWETLRDIFHQSLSNVGHDVLPVRTIRAAQKAMNEVARFGKPTHPKVTQAIHQVLLSDLVFNSAEWQVS